MKMIQNSKPKVFISTDRLGQPSSQQKGYFWKAGYHSTEFAYYAYLYGNLFYKGNPVDLYYFIDKSDKTQTVSLYPIAIEDDRLKIDAVELEGNPFESFDRDTRTLDIAANEGGIFKVTFINERTTGIDEPLTMSDMLNMKVYPNPLTDIGHIEYTIQTFTDVTIHITDISGRMLYTVKNKNAVPGTYHETILRSSLGAGNIYFVNIITDSFSTTRKLVVVD